MDSLTPDQIAYATGPGLDALLPVLVTLGLICGIVGAVLAQHKGHSAWKWYIVSAVFGLVGLSVLACLPVAGRTVPAPAVNPPLLRRVGD